MDILREEFIGCEIKVVDALNPCLVGTMGRIVDETKDTLTVQDYKQKKLIKNQIVFEIKKNKKTYRINGKSIRKRPEERIKSR